MKETQKGVGDGWMMKNNENVKRDISRSKVMGSKNEILTLDD